VKDGFFGSGLPGVQGGYGVAGQVSKDGRSRSGKRRVGIWFLSSTLGNTEQAYADVSFLEFGGAQ
jgi:hypothetical protein